MKMSLTLFILLVSGQAFAQVNDQDTIFVLIDKCDSLIKKTVHQSSASKYNATYLLYDEKLIEERDSLLKISPILPQGLCEYYQIDSYDTGKVVEDSYLKNKIVYSREDLVEKGMYTLNFYLVEKEPRGLVIRKSYPSGCE